MGLEDGENGHPIRPYRTSAPTSGGARHEQPPPRTVTLLWPRVLLPEAEDELRVVGHLLRRPRRVPRQFDLDVVDAGDLRRDAVDVLLDHRAGRAAHRREAVNDLHLRALDLDVVQQAEIDDVHAELGILDLAQ